MIKTIKCLLLFTLVNIYYAEAQSAISQDPIYRLVYSDEFDSTAMDTSNWSPLYYGWSFNQFNTNVLAASNTNCNFDIDISFNSPVDTIHNHGYDTTGTGKHSLISRY